MEGLVWLEGVLMGCGWARRKIRIGEERQDEVFDEDS
jgi:hypothetical protein